MMKCELEEVSFRSDEKVPEETTEVLAELSDIENLHFEGGVRDVGGELSQGVRCTFSTQPSRHKSGIKHDFVRPDRAEKVVDDGVSPLDQGVDSFFSGLWLSISLIGDVVFFANSIKIVVNQPVDNLSSMDRTEKTKA